MLMMRCGMVVPGQETTSLTRICGVRPLTRKLTLGVDPGVSTLGETLNCANTGRSTGAGPGDFSAIGVVGTLPNATPPLPAYAGAAAAAVNARTTAVVASAFTPLPRSRHASLDSSLLRRCLQQRELARLGDQPALAAPDQAVLFDEAVV